MKPVKIKRDVAHYSTGKMEFIHILQSKLSFEQFEGFLFGNVLKYLLRYQFKHEGEQYQDLLKMLTYGNWLAELYSKGEKK